MNRPRKQKGVIRFVIYKSITRTMDIHGTMVRVPPCMAMMIVCVVRVCA